MPLQAEKTREAHTRLFASVAPPPEPARLGLAPGPSNAQIAEQLSVSRVTVNTFLRSGYSKPGVSSRTRAIRYALDHHWLS